MAEYFTLDAIAARFPTYAIEVSRASDTGTPPHRWRARWYNSSMWQPPHCVGDTQDQALRGMLKAELTRAEESVERAKESLRAVEQHLQKLEARIVELLNLPEATDESQAEGT